MRHRDVLSYCLNVNGCVFYNSSAYWWWVLQAYSTKNITTLPLSNLWPLTIKKIWCNYRVHYWVQSPVHGLVQSPESRFCSVPAEVAFFKVKRESEQLLRSTDVLPLSKLSATLAEWTHRRSTGRRNHFEGRRSKPELATTVPWGELNCIHRGSTSCRDVEKYYFTAGLRLLWRLVQAQ